jgi:hypothetical protein
MSTRNRPRGVAIGRTARGIALLLGLAFCLAAAMPALAGADVQTVEFDEGPLEAPLETSGDISFPKELGFRPYRTNVGPRAKSGTAVGDIGRCFQETGDAPSCEFFQARTTIQLARTAERVTVFAGQFGPFDPNGPLGVAELTAFRADGTKITSSGPVRVDALDFKTPLAVSSVAAGDIASVTVVAKLRDGQGHDTDEGADLGIDDVTVTFATGKPADFSLSTTSNVVPIIQGEEVDLPLSVHRINGSSGAVNVSISNLPVGVDAVVSPNPVPGTQSTATLKLFAEDSAPDSDFNVTEATIRGSPINSGVGPALRTTKLSMRVAANFGLSSGALSDTNLPPEGEGTVPIAVPECAPADLPLKISRDIAFHQNVALSLREDEGGATGLPAEVSAEILPGAVVPPGGNLVAERTLRFRAGPNADLSGGRKLQILLEGTSGAGAGTSTRVLPITMVREVSTATVANSNPGSGLGDTPRFGGPGTRIQIHGTGFCPGTTVEVGNERATTPTTLVNDHTIEFTVPRYATTGTVRIDPPGRGAPYRTNDLLNVDSVRNRAGFQFKNYAFHSLSLSELTEAFGSDELFVTVNPCWPFGHCRVVTGILNPFVAVEWGVMNLALRNTGGHCLGMALASERLTEGEDSIRRFDTPSTPFGHPQPFDIPGPEGPGSDDLDSYLTALHSRQFSNEFIRGWAGRDKSIQDQLNLIEKEFTHNRMPVVAMFGDNGHAVLAYDMVQTPTTADIYVYDNNQPFSVGEELNGPQHQADVDRSVIHVDKARGAWSYPAFAGLHGGNGGTLWTFPHLMIPSDPSLPGLGDVSLGSPIFSAFIGSVSSTASANAEFLAPEAVSSSAGSADSGTWVAKDPHKPLDVTYHGLEKGGHYTQSYTAPGFIASANEVPTDKGVDDTVRGAGDSLTIASGESRPLQIEVAQQIGSKAEETVAATLDTHASSGGSDTAGFSSGHELTYAHDGAPTALHFSLTSVRRDGGPSTFESGPVGVGRGDRLSVTPLDRGLQRVRVTVRHADGRTATRVLRNRGAAAGHVRIGTPKLSGHQLSLRFKLAGMPGSAVVGASLRLVRGKHVLARKALSLKAANGSHKLGWHLPKGVKAGHYRLLVDLRAIAVAARGSTTTASVSAHRGAGVRVGG